MSDPLEILLVGGSGFMGRHVARAMLAAGHRVTVLARGRRSPVAGAATLTADRRDPASLAAALEARRFDASGATSRCCNRFLARRSGATS